MKYLNFFLRKSYYKTFMEELSNKKTSFGWEQITLESQLKSETDPNKIADLQEELNKVYSYRSATKKMAKATKLHDKRKYKLAANLYNEVIETGIFYAPMAKENLSKMGLK